ncbi:LysR family transcriptional regulator [soil metagenome]
MDVHLRDLRYFVVVAEHLHFTQAAQALFVSQPALSKQIGALERQLRVTLFERDPRGVQLTPAGEALLPQARAVLAGWDEGQRVLADAALRQRSTVIVGMSTGLGRGMLPAITELLADRISDAELRVRQIAWDDPTGGLAEDGARRTDGAFVWLPVPADAGLDWCDVATEEVMVALPARHKLAAGGSVDMGDLLDEPFLALPRSSGGLRDFWLAVDARDGRPIRIGGEISSTEEAVEAVAAGLGVCLLAAGNVTLVARDGVVVRRVSGVAPARLVFAWRRGDDRPLLVALREAVASVIADGYRS